jgi:hypothetical protein
MIRPLGALLLAAMALSACKTLESINLNFLEPDNGEQEAASGGPDAGGEAPPLPRRKPGPEARLAAAEIDPARLVGLDFASAKKLLGAPARQLDQPPAKIWAYNGNTCVFNLFFYPSMDDSIFRVLTYEVTKGKAASGSAGDGGTAGAAGDSPGKDTEVVRRCFADLLQSKDMSDAG